MQVRHRHGLGQVFERFVPLLAKQFGVVEGLADLGGNIPQLGREELRGFAEGGVVPASGVHCPAAADELHPYALTNRFGFA